MFKHAPFWSSVSGLLSTSYKAKLCDQRNDSLKFTSDDKLLTKKGMATPHEYFVEG